MRKNKLAIEVEVASLEEMGFLLKLAEKEGWNPGLSDALPFYRTDPAGFFIGKVEGRPVGCISAVAYNEAYGFMGFYIVIPEYRSHGFGLALWKRAIEHLSGRAIGLDGVIQQVKNYQKSGFMPYYRSCRFQGEGRKSGSHSLVQADPLLFERLLAFDASIFGVQRESFLKEWIRMENSSTLAKVKGERLLGYGTVRKAVKGYKIGPLFAENKEVAEELFSALSDVAAGEPLFLDLPLVNQFAVELARKEQMEPLFEEVRMYHKVPPKVRLPYVFGVTSFELG